MQCYLGNKHWITSEVAKQLSLRKVNSGCKIVNYVHKIDIIYISQIAEQEETEVKGYWETS